MNINELDQCPCKSGKKFGECCRPIISGEAKAKTAEELMRARYSSYVTGDVDFLRTSAVKAIQEQAKTMTHCSNLFVNEPSTKLAAKLVEIKEAIS